MKKTASHNRIVIDLYRDYHTNEVTQKVAVNNQFVYYCKSSFTSYVEDGGAVRDFDKWLCKSSYRQILGAKNSKSSLWKTIKLIFTKKRTKQ